jgi:hypothetical protein
MAIEKEEAEAPAPAERECRSEQDTAISAEDEGEPIEVEGESHPLGEAEAEAADTVGVEDGGGGVAERDIWRYGQTPRVPSVGQPLEETGRTEGVREPVDAGATQAEVGGRVNDGAGLHSRAYLSAWWTHGRAAIANPASRGGNAMNRNPRVNMPLLNKKV